MLSYWELDHWLDWDIIIIGGGIVGLSTAASLLESAPTKRVLVLERGIFPTGASTKNAGFACFGSLTELVEDRKTLSDSDVLSLVRTRWEGLRKLRVRLGDEELGYEQWGGYELISAEEDAYLSFLPEVNALLSGLFEKDVFQIQDELIEPFGFSRTHVSHLLLNPLEGQIHAGKMMRALLRYVQQLGGTILSGAKVLDIEEGSAEVEVITEAPIYSSPIRFRTEQLAICTNAFSKSFLPNLDIQAGRGQVLITEPLELPFKGVFHFQQGYYYFRNVGNRLLFGGGRNLDFVGENSQELITTPFIQSALEHLLQELILPGRSFEIAHRWAGIMAFGPNKQPICQKVSERIFAGIRLGGMGVAIGSQMGQDLCHLLLPSSDSFR